TSRWKAAPRRCRGCLTSWATSKRAHGSSGRSRSSTARWIRAPTAISCASRSERRRRTPRLRRHPRRWQAEAHPRHRRTQIDISLSKLPWGGQLAACVAVCAGAIYGFYNFYASGFDSELELKRTHLRSLQADINKGVATARRLPEFEAQVTDLEHRLETLRNVLPEQKDVADTLRRLQGPP